MYILANFLLKIRSCIWFRAPYFSTTTLEEMHTIMKTHASYSTEVLLNNFILHSSATVRSLNSKG